MNVTPVGCTQKGSDFAFCVTVSDNDKRSSLLLKGVNYSKKVLWHWPQFVGVADFEKWKKNFWQKKPTRFNSIKYLYL